MCKKGVQSQSGRNSSGQCRETGRGCGGGGGTARNKKNKRLWHALTHDAVQLQSTTTTHHPITIKRKSEPKGAHHQEDSCQNEALDFLIRKVTRIQPQTVQVFITVIRCSNHDFGGSSPPHSAHNTAHCAHCPVPSSQSVNATFVKICKKSENTQYLTS